MYIDVPRSILADFHEVTISDDGDLKYNNGLLNQASSVATDLDDELDVLLIKLTIVKRKADDFRTAVNEFIRANDYYEKHLDDDYAKDRLYEANLALRAIVTEHFKN